MMSKMSFPIPKPLIDTCNHLKEKDWQAFTPPSFAPHDLIFCLDFLKQYDNNNATFESYRREVERLIHWAWLIEKKSLLDLKRQDIENYIQFCLDPPKAWIGFKKISRFITRNSERIPNPEWRPLDDTISKASHKNG